MGGWGTDRGGGHDGIISWIIGRNEGVLLVCGREENRRIGEIKLQKREGKQRGQQCCPVLKEYMERGIRRRRWRKG